jgi:phosphoribosylglycinamide formyltransferase 1
MTRIAVFASGRGTNFDAILASMKARKLDAEVVALVCDKPEAPVIAKARSAGLRTIVQSTKGLDRRTHEEAILAELRPLRPEFLVLAGYMRLFTPELIEEFRTKRGYSRIVNVHPSLLPAFPGTGGYAQAFEHGAKIAGATVHLVDEGLDCGPILAQEAFAIHDCRSAEEVEKRGLAVENRLYPETLRWVLAEKFQVSRQDKGRLRVSPH